MTKKVLITGAGGFVGRAAVQKFLSLGWPVRGLVRSLENSELWRTNGSEYVVAGDIENISDWRNYCRGCNVVVHLAARAHKFEKHESDAEIFDRVNRDATVRLAQAAIDCGVERFIFISSAGVMGDFSDKPFTERDLPAPVSEYAKSKLKAEIALAAVCHPSEMTLTILRPTLIYGPDNPGNLERLVKLIGKGIPLPFGGITSRRSLVSVQHFVEIIFQCCVQPTAAGKVYLVSDGEDISTRQLIKSLALSTGKRAILFPFPIGVLRMVASVVGKRHEIEKLLRRLQVDSSTLRMELGIKAISTQEYLEKK